MSSPQTISRYELIDRIGEGGMGSLYLARDPMLDRLVAVKVLREGFGTPELHERFVREARAVARLDHENIVRIYDFGEHEGRPFIAMQYIAGETVAEKISRRASLPLPTKLKLLEELCNGLHHAHRAHLIHRDIKPANLIVSPDGVLKILDFGIARSLDSTMTQAGMLVGTLNYMSPEQIQGQPVDRRSDIFAVGAVAYELLSYRQAFPGRLEDGLFNRITSEQPPALEGICPSLPPALAPVVAKALQKLPPYRQQTLEEMRRGLRAIRLTLSGGEDQEPTDAEEQTVAVSVDAVRIGARGEREALRKAEADSHVEAAKSALEAGDLESALAHVENALASDTEHQGAAELRARIRRLRDEKEAERLATQASNSLAAGDLTTAELLLDHAARLAPASSRVQLVRGRLEAATREAEERRNRRRRAEGALTRARAALARGAFDSALRAANEALATDAALAEAEAVRDQAASALAQERARRQAQEEEERRVRADEARRRAEGEAAARAAEAEATRRRVAEAAVARAAEVEEAARRRTEEQAAARAAEAEATRRRVAEVAAARAAEEEAARRRTEEQAAAAAHAAEQEAVRRRTAEEQALRRLVEDQVAAPAVAEPEPSPVPLRQATIEQPPTAASRPKVAVSLGIAATIGAISMATWVAHRPSQSETQTVAPNAAVDAKPLTQPPTASSTVPGAGLLVPASPADNAPSSPANNVSTDPAASKERTRVATGRAEQFLSARNHEAALVVVTEALSIDKQDPQLTQLVDRIVASSRNAAAASEQVAVGAGASAALPPFADGLRARNEGRRLAASGNRAGAVRAWARASMAFDRAAQDAGMKRAESAPPAPQPEARPPLVTGPAAVPETSMLGSSAPPLAVPAPPSSDRAAERDKKAASDDGLALAAQERGAIQAVVRRFGGAYETRSMDALRAVWPKMPRDVAQTYARVFSNSQSLRWSASSERIDVQGAKATATVVVATEAVDIRGRRTPDTRTYVFTLEKTAGAWRISGMLVRSA